MEHNGEAFNKFTVPVRWGIIISLVSVFITTIYGMFIMQSLGLIGMGIFGVVSFIVIMLLLTYMGSQQRKAMGGYITFKEAFSAIFVSILIIVSVSTIYTYVYTNFIDTEYFDKVKQMSVDLTYKLGGDEAADAASAATDEEIEKQKGISGILMSFSTSVILYSLFGFIIAAVIKKNKPEHLA